MLKLGRRRRRNAESSAKGAGAASLATLSVLAPARPWTELQPAAGMGPLLPLLLLLLLPPPLPRALPAPASVRGRQLPGRLGE